MGFVIGSGSHVATVLGLLKLFHGDFADRVLPQLGIRAAGVRANFDFYTDVTWFAISFHFCNHSDFCKFKVFFR